MNEDLLNADEMQATAQAILAEIDRPTRRSDTPPKTILVDFSGTSKAGKTTLLHNVEQFFHREGFRIFTTTEGAEIEKIRALPPDNAFSFQARHLSYTLANVLDFARSRDFHMVIFDRGVLDNLTWLEREARKKGITRKQQKHMRDFILAGEWIDAIDAYFVLTCRPEVALEREYGQAVTQKRGSKMNEENLRASMQIHEAVFGDLENRLPQLPLFWIDTSGGTEAENSQRILSDLLKTVQRRLALNEERILPRSVPLLRHHALRADRSQYVQLKFRAKLGWETLQACSWDLAARTQQHDTYLLPHAPSELYPGEALLIRQEGDQYCFTYKGMPSADLASVRPKVVLPLLAEDRAPLTAGYEKIAQVRKSREIYTRGDFVLMCDTVDDLGEFIELHAPDAGKIPELWALAQELGFTEQDLVRESYLELVQQKKR